MNYESGREGGGGHSGLHIKQAGGYITSSHSIIILLTFSAQLHIIDNI